MQWSDFALANCRSHKSDERTRCICLLFPASSANAKNTTKPELLNTERWLISKHFLFLKEIFGLFSWDLSCCFVGFAFYAVCHIIWATNRWRERYYAACSTATTIKVLGVANQFSAAPLCQICQQAGAVVSHNYSTNYSMDIQTVPNIGTIGSESTIPTPEPAQEQVHGLVAQLVEQSTAVLAAF